MLQPLGSAPKGCGGSPSKTEGAHTVDKLGRVCWTFAHFGVSVPSPGGRRGNEVRCQESKGGRDRVIRMCCHGEGCRLACRAVRVSATKVRLRGRSCRDGAQQQEGNGRSDAVRLLTRSVLRRV